MLQVFELEEKDPNAPEAPPEGEEGGEVEPPKPIIVQVRCGGLAGVWRVECGRGHSSACHDGMGSCYCATVTFSPALTMGPLFRACAGP